MDMGNATSTLANAATSVGQAAGQAAATITGNGSAKRSFLKVTGRDITLDGEPVLLKGAGLGGWSE